MHFYQKRHQYDLDKLFSALLVVLRNNIVQLIMGILNTINVQCSGELLITKRSKFAALFDLNRIAFKSTWDSPQKLRVPIQYEYPDTWLTLRFSLGDPSNTGHLHQLIGVALQYLSDASSRHRKPLK